MATRKSFRRDHPLVVRALLLLFAFGVASLFGLAFGSWALVCRGGQCPSVEALNDYTPHQTSKLYAVDGRFIAELGLERRTLVKIDEIPKIVQDAFVSTEDKRFYQHAGIDWYRVFGALARDILARGWDQGFSTITMQLARNVFPERLNAREKTWSGKLPRGEGRARDRGEVRQEEDSRAVPQSDRPRPRRVRRRDGIAALLREIGPRPEPRRSRNPRRAPQGPGALQPAQVSGARDPAPQHRHRADAPERRDQRRRRQRRACIPAPARNKAEAGDVAPYFVEWVRQQLDAQFGKQLYEQGLKVYTTLDLDMQGAAERALERQLRLIESGRYGRFIARELRALRRAQSGGHRDGRELAVSPERVPRARSAQRRGARDDRRTRFRRLEVQSLGSGAAPARLGVQADRVLRGDSERQTRVVHRQRLADRRPAAGRTEEGLGAKELRRKIPRPDADAARTVRIAQHRRDPRRHGARRANGHKRRRGTSASPLRFRRIRRSTSAPPTSIRSS